jgi:Glycosyl hydrolase family 99
VHRSRLILSAVAVAAALCIVATTVSAMPTATTLATTAAAPSRAAVGFQPSAPYYATFFYPWYKNAACDGSYSYWQDGGNRPPRRWFSHYLPDPHPSRFDPKSELYSSLDYGTFKWEVAKMAEAKQEVAITSWFGRGTKQDVALKTYLDDFMKRPDNPYPNLRFALYYEQEGFGDPTVSQLVADLEYIKTAFASSPYFLKVKGKPVIFVYGNGSDGAATSRRWKDAVAQTGDSFYYVLKVYSGYASDPNQPSSWHQYAPAGRYGSFARRSTFVSPGFWKDAAGETVRLRRNLTAFKSAVRRMVAARTTWNLVETWNEWGEGTAVEPGVQTKINASGREVLNPTGARFGNAYVRVLANTLPALERGTGH